VKSKACGVEKEILQFKRRDHRASIVVTYPRNSFRKRVIIQLAKILSPDAPGYLSANSEHKSLKTVLNSGRSPNSSHVLLYSSLTCLS